MARPEAPIPDTLGPVGQLAAGLREVRSSAGLSYRQMQQSSHFHYSAFSKAAAGKSLPTLEVVHAFLRACGTVEEEILTVWAERWEQARDHIAVPELAPKVVPPSPAPAEPAKRRGRRRRRDRQVPDPDPTDEPAPAEAPMAAVLAAPRALVRALSIAGPVGLGREPAKPGRHHLVPYTVTVADLQARVTQAPEPSRGHSQTMLAELDAHARGQRLPVYTSRGKLKKRLSPTLQFLLASIILLSTATLTLGLLIYMGARSNAPEFLPIEARKPITSFTISGAGRATRQTLQLYNPNSKSILITEVEVSVGSPLDGGTKKAESCSGSLVNVLMTKLDAIEMPAGSSLAVEYVMQTSPQTPAQCTGTVLPITYNARTRAVGDSSIQLTTIGDV